MPIVAKPKTASDFSQGFGFNDLIRRTFFPGWPPTQCVRGYVFFPWGTGPTFPVPCDRDFRVFRLGGSAGSQFLTRKGSSFASAVAEVGGLSLAEATRAVASAAGVRPADLKRLTVKDIGKRIFQRAGRKLGIQNVKPADGDSVENYFRRLAQRVRDIDAAKAVEDLSRQTGLAAGKVRDLPLSELRDYLDISGSPPGGSVARSSGTLACVSGGGSTRCTILTGALEGAVWGGIIGGAIGGGAGAAIGAVIGAIIGWLFD